MIEQEIVDLIGSLGFPIVVTLLLLYDKLKSNNSLRKAVENNTEILKKIEEKLLK